MTSNPEINVMTRIKEAASNLTTPPWHLLKGEFLRRKQARENEIATLEQQCAAFEQQALAAATAILTRHQFYVLSTPKNYQEAINQLLEVKNERK
ncbi:hypothetical protein [Aliiglaciecola aliphaticivorans]